MTRLSMRFDLRVPPFAKTSFADQHQAMLEMVAWADRLGFESVVLSEHHGDPAGFTSAPITLAAAVLGAPISTTVMVFELTGGFALSLALMLTVAIANGISQAVLGRSLFQAQLESRGIVLHDGPHRTVMKDIRVSDIMRPLPEGEPNVLAEGERQHVLLSDETLETALRIFDSLGAERLPVVANHDRSKILGFASQARALAAFNKALIDASVEEHR